MFYVKTEINDNIEIKVDLYDNEIFTRCPSCGEEMQVSIEELKQVLEDGDLAGTSLYCKKCTNKFLNK